MEEQLIKYIDNELSHEERIFVEQQLAESAEWRKTLAELRSVLDAMENADRLQPSSHLRNRFDLFLDKEIVRAEKIEKAKIVRLPFKLWQVAAAVALLVIGVGFGILFQSNQQQKKALHQMQQQMDSQRKMLVLSMLEKSSASERIKALNISQEKTESADSQVIEAFVEVLRNDENLNVRLKTVEALVHFGADEKAIEGLLKTLKMVDEPLLQIAIIDALVNLKTPEAVEGLQRIIQQKETNPIVKQKAASGLEALI